MPPLAPAEPVDPAFPLADPAEPVELEFPLADVPAELVLPVAVLAPLLLMAEGAELGEDPAIELDGVDVEPDAAAVGAGELIVVLFVDGDGVGDVTGAGTLDSGFCIGVVAAAFSLALLF